MARYSVLVTTLAMVLCHASAQGPTLDIPGLGTVMGDTALSYVSDRIYYRFRGMPFAQQPVGPELRFKAPGPVEPWVGVFNATAVGNRCPQVTVDIGNKTNPMKTNKVSTTEDCLYLSVYTPNPTTGANLPVVVFFHGGAFEAGSGIIYDGQKFMDYDVILVVAHYRLGPFGFLCLHTDDIPGNAGMLDQVAALQWTRDYISVFGGDPNAITIMGESAGAASVSLHNISPLSTSMFKQYIPQSGASTAVWAIDYNAVYAATEIGKLLNCSSLEIPELTTCFQNVDTLELLYAHSQFQDNELKEGRSPFQATSPVVQKAGAVRFLERKPREILDSGEYTPHAALIGANKHEGTLVYSIFHLGYMVPNNLLEDEIFLQREFSNIMNDFFAVQDQGESVSAIMEKSHFGQSNMGNYTAITPGLVDYFGNMFLKGPAYEQAQYNSKVAPTYLYGFHYFGDRTVWPFIGDPNVITGGVNHAQELLLQFDIPGLILSARDRAMSKTVMNLWINFIVNGNPTPASNPVEGVPTWPMFDGTTRFANYLVINENSTSYVASDWTRNEFFVSGNEGFPWLTDHLLLAALAAILGQGAAQGPTLDIPGLGTVMGDTALSYVNDRIYYRFRGMPFAAPPVGPELRFKAPGPVQPWAGVFNATRVGNRCPQVTVDLNGTNIFDYSKASDTEDCLYLSVYTPNPTAGANLPVVVFYHGGSFESGSGIIYDGQKFMDYDVVLVVPHYRLGPFGFLSLDTDDIPGNAGMIDQVAALQWTRDHISVFGGDVNAITIMGESAGAASVSLHNISPLSTSLFKQYIPQSGAATAVWAIDYTNIYAATEIGKLLNCTGLDIPTLTVCLQTADTLELLRAHSQFQDNELKAGRNPFAATSPVVQKAGAVRFLERRPRDILDSGEYTPHPALIGANKHEGTLVYTIFYKGYMEANNLLQDEVFLQRNISNLMTEFFAIRDQGESVSAILERSHFGSANMGNFTAMTPGLVDYLGDMFLKGPVYENCLYNYQVAPTYLYGFHYYGDRSVWQFIGDPDVITGGVNHAQELLLQFDIPGLILSARDRAMSKTLMQLWINFITYGNPTPASNPVEGVPTWPMFDGSTRSGNYLVINENNSSYVASDWTLNEFFVSGNEGFPWLTDH